MKKTYCLLAIAVCFAMSQAPVRAAFIQGDSGNSKVLGSSFGSLKAGLNFAVLDQTGGAVGDTFDTGDSTFNAQFVTGTGSGGLDTSATYLYLYQITNNSASGPNSVTTFNIQTLGDGTITSWGYFSALGFKDNNPNNGGAVTATVNSSPTPNFFGTDTGAYTTNASAQLGVTSPGVLTITGGVSPSSVVNDTPDDLITVSFTGLSPGNRSVLFGFTSNLAPSLVLDSLIGRDSGSGTAPDPIVPEPSPVVMLCGGLPLLGFGAWLGRRKLLNLPAAG